MTSTASIALTDRGVIQAVPLRRISDIDSHNPDCPRCDGTGWVCENHVDKPWADGALYPGAHGKPGCNCGAGAPCPGCNALALEPLTDRGQA